MRKGTGKGFEFYDDYAVRAMNLQPQLYDEIGRIMNTELKNFILKNKRKPLVLDIGSGGVIPYDADLVKKITILDLFPKPEGMSVPQNCKWIIGDILSENIQEILKGGKYDMVLMASLLHHLCDNQNDIIRNLGIAFRNSSKLLSRSGVVYIFESTCPKLLTKLEDLLYPTYTWIFINLLKFTYVRMLSLDEIVESLKSNGFEIKILDFKQPEYIAQMFWRVPTKLYPLKVSAIKCTL